MEIKIALNGMYYLKPKINNSISLKKLKKLKKKGDNMSTTKTTENNVLLAEVIQDKEIKPLVEIEKEYQEKIQKLQKPKSWIRWVIAAGAILGSLFLVSLVANQIITGAIALAIAAGVGISGYYILKLLKNYDPVIQEKIKNDAINKLIKQAQEDKIAQLIKYQNYLERYLRTARELRNNNDMLLKKFYEKLENTENETLKAERAKIIKKLVEMKEAIETVEKKAKKTLDDFKVQVTIAKEKLEVIEETQDLVTFLQNSGSSFEKFLVDESLNQLEKEFLDITVTINNLSKDLEREKEIK